MKNDKLPDYFKEYLDERFATLEEKLDELTKIVKGNGKPGLIKRVEDLEGLKLWVVGVAIGGTAIMSFIWDHVIHLVK